MFGKELLKPGGWKRQLYTIIFEADTPAGKKFDVTLLWAILLSVALVIVETMPEISDENLTYLRAVEWILTVLFTIEYVLRIVCVGKPLKYVFSFYGVIDLMSIVPTYLSLFFVGSHYLVVVRALRLLRVFRVLKLGHFVGQSDILIGAMNRSKEKIIIFIGFLLTIALIIGALMYLIEGPENGFTSIPTGIYWAIVTLTTVGYGDVSPHTALGQFLATIVMVMGYGILAVPTGIVSAELVKGDKPKSKVCPKCAFHDHDSDAKFCKKCGTALPPID